MMIKRTIWVLGIIAAFFAGSAYADGDPEAGKTKAAQCASCHGENGEGVGDNPPIAGLEACYHLEQLKAYQAGTREDPMMQMFVSQLSEQDMADIAAYFATLKKPE